LHVLLKCIKSFLFQNWKHKIAINVILKFTSRCIDTVIKIKQYICYCVRMTQLVLWMNILKWYHVYKRLNTCNTYIISRWKRFDTYHFECKNNNNWVQIWYSPFWISKIDVVLVTILTEINISKSSPADDVSTQLKK
jgi:hypothetical protein